MIQRRLVLCYALDCINHDYQRNKVVKISVGSVLLAMFLFMTVHHTSLQKVVFGPKLNNISCKCCMDFSVWKSGQMWLTVNTKMWLVVLLIVYCDYGIFCLILQQLQGWYMLVSSTEQNAAVFGASFWYLKLEYVSPLIICQLWLRHARYCFTDKDLEFVLILWWQLRRDRVHRSLLWWLSDMPSGVHVFQGWKIGLQKTNFKKPQKSKFYILYFLSNFIQVIII